MYSRNLASILKFNSSEMQCTNTSEYYIFWNRSGASRRCEIGPRPRRWEAPWWCSAVAATTVTASSPSRCLTGINCIQVLKCFKINLGDSMIVNWHAYPLISVLVFSTSEQWVEKPEWDMKLGRFSFCSGQIIYSIAL